MTAQTTNMSQFKRVPKHIGIIPDGNRRWALAQHLDKQDGYAHGVAPGVRLYQMLMAQGVEELTFYGFTKDNTNRPTAQTKAYVQACIDAVESLATIGANILVVGKTDSKVFPEELLKYTQNRVVCGKGGIKANFLINYDWGWDLNQGIENLSKERTDRKTIETAIASHNISMLNMIIRWGGHTRLSGFLPVQSVYADFYVVKDFWPDFKESHVTDALSWYQNCDVTMGG